MLVLPAPVGPVMTNRSSGSKSISWRSRKAVKPSIASLSGRTGDLLEELVEQRDEALVGRRAMAVAVVAREERAWREAPQLARLALARRALVVEAHLERVRENLAHIVGEPGGRAVAAQHHAQVGVGVDVHGAQVLERAGDVEQRPAAGQRKQPRPRGQARLHVDDDDALGL